MRSLAVESIHVRAFRNLRSVDVEFGSSLNVVSGENGQGKTNVLEAVYVLATSRSFRTSKQAELLQVGTDVASVRGRIREGTEDREQSIGLLHGSRAARINGKQWRTLASYAVQTPAVVFHPGTLGLSTGSGSDRRRFLDRISLYMSPTTSTEASSYSQASRSRQRVLSLRGDAAPDLEHWEELMVKHGLALIAARSAAADAVLPAAERSFARFAANGRTLRARYTPGGPFDAAKFQADLRKLRARDRLRGSATIGPHRDDVSLEIGGHPARGVASQGQHRAIVLALELAEIEIIERARSVRPVLLLDDVSSELDGARTRALFEALRQETGQVLLTTTRPELISGDGFANAPERRDFHVVDGAVHSK